MTSKYLKLIIYEFKQTIRRKEIIFWVILWPLFWLFMAFFVFIPSEKSIHISVKIGILDLDKTENTTVHFKVFMSKTWEFKTKNFTADFINTFKELNGSNNIFYKLKLFKDVSNESKFVHDLIYNKGFDVVISILNNSSLNYTYNFPVKLRIYVKYENPAKYYQLIGYLMNIISRFNINKTIERVNMYVNYAISGFRYYMNYSRYFNYSKWNVTEDFVKWFRYALIGWYFGLAYPTYPELKEVKPKVYALRSKILGWTTVGLIGFMMMYTILISSIGVFAFRSEEGVLRRLIVSGFKLRDLIIVDFLSTLLLVLLASLVLIITGVALGAEIVFNPFNLDHWISIGITLLTVLFMYMLGLLIAPFVKNAKTATSIGVILGLLIVFLTGIYWPPKEMLPIPLQVFASNFPPAISFDILKVVIVWNKPITQLLPDIIKVITGSLLITAVIILLYWKRLEKLLSKFM